MPSWHPVHKICFVFNQFEQNELQDELQDEEGEESNEENEGEDESEDLKTKAARISQSRVRNIVRFLRYFSSIFLFFFFFQSAVAEYNCIMS